MVEVWQAVLAEVGSQGEAALREQTFGISRSGGKRKQAVAGEGQALVTTDKSCELHALFNVVHVHEYELFACTHSSRECVA